MAEHPPSQAIPAGMLRIVGGTFTMGSDRHYPEEAPAHRLHVDGFLLDRFPVTNRQFAAFVAATGYRTVAERPLDPASYPRADRSMLAPGSMVFQPPRGPVDLRDIRNWWVWKRGACWRHPEGRGSSVAARLNHPVVHIAFEDAEAYAHWIGKALPSEAEWEYAARGGLEDAEYAWGDRFAPDGRRMAHTWHGDFPWQNLSDDASKRTAEVGRFPANGFGLFDMIGNVWEWTTDWFCDRHRTATETPCCALEPPHGGSADASYDPTQPDVRVPRKVVKGGSFLCAPTYCRRYRPAARHAQMIDSGMSHIGFRCVLRAQHDEGEKS